MSHVTALVIDEARTGLALSRLLEADGDIAAITAGPGTAPATAVGRHRPDVLVLVAASETGALHSIREVMSRQPVPILVLTRTPVSRTKALSAGAVDVMSAAHDGAEQEAALRRRVKSLSRLTVARQPESQPRPAGMSSWPIVGIAASTGGPQAVAVVLSGLKGFLGSVLVVQHIHPEFVKGFQAWMGRESPLPVADATDGELLRRGRVYIAPANFHLRVGPARHVELDPEPHTLHRPSADVLFNSIAARAERWGVGVLLTGMGDDGVDGLLAIRRAGGHTIVQDEESSVVYGMPKAAAQAGAAERVLPLTRIAAAILRTAVAVA